MEILFRGKPDIDQEWLDDDEYMQSLVGVNYKDGFVYGQLVYSGKQPYIVGEVVESMDDEWIALEYWVPVKPETVGQYTGLKDSNGKKIFEGDLLATDLDRPVNEIKFIDGAFKEECYCDGEFYTDFMRDGKKELIVGNIHDNPELLGVQK